MKHMSQTLDCVFLMHTFSVVSDHYNDRYNAHTGLDKTCVHYLCNDDFTMHSTKSPSHSTTSMDVQMTLFYWKTSWLYAVSKLFFFCHGSPSFPLQFIVIFIGFYAVTASPLLSLFLSLPLSTVTDIFILYCLIQGSSHIR